MELKVDHTYRDGKGRDWTVVQTGVRSVSSNMVMATRWEGKRHQARLFYSDGRYLEDEQTHMDLVKKVK